MHSHRKTVCLQKALPYPSLRNKWFREHFLLWLLYVNMLKYIEQKQSEPCRRQTRHAKRLRLKKLKKADRPFHQPKLSPQNYLLNYKLIYRPNYSFLALLAAFRSSPLNCLHCLNYRAIVFYK